MTHIEARELASQFGSRMCDENGDTHGEELYCVSLDDIIAIKKALAQPQQEPVATKLESQQLHGFPVSAEDFKKLKALPVGTKLYTTPQEQSAQRARDDAESWDDRYGTGGSYGIGGCYGPAAFTDGGPDGY